MHGVLQVARSTNLNLSTMDIVCTSFDARQCVDSSFLLPCMIAMSDCPDQQTMIEYMVRSTVVLPNAYTLANCSHKHLSVQFLNYTSLDGP
jgi:hypothetical protein